MNSANIGPLRAVLMSKLVSSHGKLRGELMSRATFLHDLWRALSTFALDNRNNSLMHGAASQLENSDLIPRAFLILSILYGSYEGERDEMEPLKDFIGMLGRDLYQEELRVCKYADGKIHTFFPELRFVWQTIREVYGTKEFDLTLLPPTPYRAYSLLVLHRPEIAFSPAHLDTVFDILAGLNHRSQKVIISDRSNARPHLMIVK